MTITQEQFDNLKEGDVVNNKHNGNLFFQGKVGKVSFWINSSGFSNVLSIADMQNLEYSLVTKPENYKGFPLGQYDDKIVLVAVSNTEQNPTKENCTATGIIRGVSKEGVYINNHLVCFRYAQLINTTPFQLV